MVASDMKRLFLYSYISACCICATSMLYCAAKGWGAATAIAYILLVVVLCVAFTKND